MRMLAAVKVGDDYPSVVRHIFLDAQVDCRLQTHPCFKDQTVRDTILVLS